MSDENSSVSTGAEEHCLATIRTESGRLFRAARMARHLARNHGNQAALAGVSAASRTAADAALRLRAATDQLLT